MFRQEIVPEPGGIFVAEPVAPIVAMPAKLRLALDKFKLTGVGLETKVVAAEIRRFAGRHRLDSSTAAAIGCVNPVVEAVFEAINAMLLIALVETDENRFAHVGLAVTIGVCGVKNFRRGADEHALAPDHDAVREIDVLQKHRRFVVTAVAVGVFQIFDDAARFAMAVQAKGIVAHLDDPEFSIRSPVKGDRVNDERFVCDKFNFETGPHADAGQRFLR